MRETGSRPPRWVRQAIPITILACIGLFLLGGSMILMAVTDMAKARAALEMNWSIQGKWDNGPRSAQPGKEAINSPGEAPPSDLASENLKAGEKVIASVMQLGPPGQPPASVAYAYTEKQDKMRYLMVMFTALIAAIAAMVVALIGMIRTPETATPDKVTDPTQTATSPAPPAPAREGLSARWPELARPAFIASALALPIAIPFVGSFGVLTSGAPGKDGRDGRDFTGGGTVDPNPPPVPAPAKVEVTVKPLPLLVQVTGTPGKTGDPGVKGEPGHNGHNGRDLDLSTAWSQHDALVKLEHLMLDCIPTPNITTSDGSPKLRDYLATHSPGELCDLPSMTMVPPRLEPLKVAPPN